MEYILKNNLCSEEPDKISDLEQTCREADGFSYELYTGDDSETSGDFFVLCYTGSELIGFLSYFNADVPEISGIVHPKFRRQKVFSHMFETVENKLMNKEIVFSGRELYPGFTKTALSLGGSNPYHEYLLKWNKKTIFSGNLGILYDSSSAGQYRDFDFWINECQVGHCSLFTDSAAVNIFDVYIEPEFRGLGYGKAMLNRLLSHISGQSNKNIILQVSEKNKPACNLYFTNGFEVIDSVLYYSRFV